MKTTITLVVMLFYITMHSQAQRFEYDFDKGEFTNPIKGVEDNSTVSVIVKNYNPLRFTLGVNSTPSGLQYQQKPDSFKYFDLPREQFSSWNGHNSIDSYKTFYNAMVSLNTDINELKKRKTLTETEIEIKLAPKVKNAKDGISKCLILDCSEVFNEILAVLKEDIEEAKRLYKIRLEVLEKEEKNSETERKIEECKFYLAKYSDFINKINEKYENDLTTIINNYKSLSSLNYETEQDVWVEDTDRIKLKIIGNDSYLNKPIDRTIANIVVKKWFKIDFSTGGFWSRLYDEDYSKNVQSTISEGNTVTNSYTINKLDKGKNSFGAMAFINFHTQQSSYLNYGVSIGTGLLFNQSTKIVLAPTASLLFGDNQRVVLHIGIALAQVDRIISGYGDGVAFSDGNYNPVIKQFVGAEIMAGLSWNLTK